MLVCQLRDHAPLLRSIHQYKFSKDYYLCELLAHLIEMGYGFGTALRIVATLNKQRSKACTGQDEGAKKSGTACAYHYGTLAGSLREHCWKCKYFGFNAFDVLGYRSARKLMQQVLLGSQSAAKCKAIREYQYDVIAFSCVNGAPM